MLISLCGDYAKCEVIVFVSADGDTNYTRVDLLSRADKMFDVHIAATSYHILLVPYA